MLQGETMEYWQAHPVKEIEARWAYAGEEFEPTVQEVYLTKDQCNRSDWEKRNVTQTQT